MTRRNRVLSAAAAALALSAGLASAADLPTRKAPPAYIPPAPVMTWTGFYVGLNAGYGWSQDPSTSTVGSNLFAMGPGGPFLNTAIGSALGATTQLSPSNGGFVGGGQIGFNYQLSPSFVAGVEADIQGVFGDKSTANAFTLGPVPAPPGPAGTAYQTFTTADRKLDYLGTVRARAGFLVTPSFLLYATGGLAYGHVSSGVSMLQTYTAPPALQPVFGGANSSATRVGWTIGGGGEWKFASNWSAKLEYLYYDLGSVSNTFGMVQVGPPRPALQFVNAVASRTSFKGHLVRVGVNYHFNWGGAAPVVAKY